MRSGDTLQIQINTDHNIEGNEKLAEHVASVVRDDLGSLAEHVTRVEVHLRDESGGHAPAQGEDHMRCMLEARLEGRQPLAVTHQSASVHQAIDGASAKLKRVVAGALREQQ